MAHLLHDIAHADTPEKLHMACLPWYLQRDAGSVASVDAPWLFFHLPAGVEFNRFKLGFELPGRLEWPDCQVRNFGVRNPDGLPDGRLYLLWMRDGSAFDPYFVWSVAVYSERPVISAQGGWESPALLIPPDFGECSEMILTPDSIWEALQVVVCTGRFDMMQLLAIRAAGPVRIPGFPKFYWESTPQGEVASFTVNGQKVL